MSRAGGIRCLLGVALALLATPALAAASPLGLPAGLPPQLRTMVGKHLPQPKASESFRDHFELQTKSGYTVSVSGEGSDVIVEVSRKAEEAVTAYAARGTVTRRRLEASFGALGRISVRFKPSGKVAQPKPGRRCRGADKFTGATGTFVGQIQLPGENGFLALDAKRAKGLIRGPRNPRCPGSLLGGSGRHPDSSHGSGHGGDLLAPPAFLSATDRKGVAATELTVIKIGKKTLLLALDEHSEGDVGIFRFAITIGPAKTLSFDDALTSAHLSPPAPFKGTGVYKAAPDGSKTWGGSLSVNFPGAPRLPIAGPDYEVSLEVGF